MKTCCTCKIAKELNFFGIGKSQPDGLNRQCKECKSTAGKVTRAKTKALSKAIPTEKTCSHCRMLKPAIAFDKCSNNKDGLQYQCKECRHNHYEETTEHVLAYQAEYRANNAEAVAANKKEYYLKNKKPKQPRKVKNRFNEAGGRVCICCGNYKHPSNFSELSASSDGLNYTCKDCISKEYYDGHENNLAKAAASREKNAEAIYERTHTPKALAERNAYQKARYAANPQYYTEKNAEWKKNNVEERRFHNSMYRAKKAKATLPWADLEAIKRFYKNCPPGYEVDHIIPLTHPNVTGLHVIWNLQYLTKAENSKKRNKFDGTYDNNSWRNS